MLFSNLEELNFSFIFLNRESRIFSKKLGGIQKTEKQTALLSTLTLLTLELHLPKAINLPVISIPVISC